MKKHFEFYKVWTDGSVGIVFGDGTYTSFRSVDEATWAGFLASDAELCLVKLDSFKYIEGKAAVAAIENRGI